jgi:GMP synthase (glutamine-hydrolysing)
MEARLKTGLWIKALIRRCDLAAVAVAVVARGDGDAGAVLLKLNAREEGCSVLAQARGPGGELIWMRATGPAPVDEGDADSYIARQRRRDPDLWVVEIETGSPGAVLDGHIV